MYYYSPNPPTLNSLYKNNPSFAANSAQQQDKKKWGDQLTAFRDEYRNNNFSFSEQAIEGLRKLIKNMCLSYLRKTSGAGVPVDEIEDMVQEGLLGFLQDLEDTEKQPSNNKTSTHLFFVVMNAFRKSRYGNSTISIPAADRKLVSAYNKALQHLEQPTTENLLEALNLKYPQQLARIKMAKNAMSTPTSLSQSISKDDSGTPLVQFIGDSSSIYDEGNKIPYHPEEHRATAYMTLQEEEKLLKPLRLKYGDRPIPSDELLNILEPKIPKNQRKKESRDTYIRRFAKRHDLNYISSHDPAQHRPTAYFSLEEEEKLIEELKSLYQGEAVPFDFLQEFLAGKLNEKEKEPLTEDTLCTYASRFARRHNLEVIFEHSGMSRQQEKILANQLKKQYKDKPIPLQKIREILKPYVKNDRFLQASYIKSFCIRNGLKTLSRKETHPEELKEFQSQLIQKHGKGPYDRSDVLTLYEGFRKKKLTQTIIYFLERELNLEFKKSKLKTQKEKEKFVQELPQRIGTGPYTLRQLQLAYEEWIDAPIDLQVIQKLVKTFQISTRRSQKQKDKV